MRRAFGGVSAPVTRCSCREGAGGDPFRRSALGVCPPPPLGGGPWGHPEPSCFWGYAMGQVLRAPGPRGHFPCLPDPGGRDPTCGSGRPPPRAPRAARRRGAAPCPGGGPPAPSASPGDRTATGHPHPHLQTLIQHNLCPKTERIIAYKFQLNPPPLSSIISIQQASVRWGRRVRSPPGGLSSRFEPARRAWEGTRTERCTPARRWAKAPSLRPRAPSLREAASSGAKGLQRQSRRICSVACSDGCSVAFSTGCSFLQ